MIDTFHTGGLRSLKLSHWLLDLLPLPREQVQARLLDGEKPHGKELKSSYFSHQTAGPRADLQSTDLTCSCPGTCRSPPGTDTAPLACRLRSDNDYLC